jgi:hypothetical protein
VTNEPTIPVPMTQAQRDWHAEQLAWLRHDKPYAFGAIAQHQALVAAYDAAAARAAEPERTVRWCEVHDRPEAICADELSPAAFYKCRVTTREVGGVVGGGA